MDRFNSSQKVGDIVISFPKAADVLKEYKIDFCCGGNRLFSEVIKEQGLDEEEILIKLNQLYAKFANNSTDRKWQEATEDELVEHIVNKHHAYLWSELPEISRLTTLILRVHGPNHPELARVHKLFHMLKMELEAHLTKEEAVQYPAIKTYIAGDLKTDLKAATGIIHELEEEHTAAGDLLKELRKVSKDFSIPDDACDSFKSAYQKLQELESDVFQHIHLENNILFPRLMMMQA